MGSTTDETEFAARTEGAVAKRLKFIDGLRAVAILLVMLFHFYYQQFTIAGTVEVEPRSLQRVLQYGNMGVYIFFVISGFIVSWVTYGQINDFKFIGRFIVRRQVRLDPPFWLAIAAGVFLTWFSSKYFRNDIYIPTGSDILLNATYLFDIFGGYDIIRVGWTLCLEIQFYLAFMLVMISLHRYGWLPGVRVIVYVVLFLLSITSYSLFSVSLKPYIFNYWHVFFLGVAVTLVIKSEISTRTFFIMMTAPCVLLFTHANATPVFFAVPTAILIYSAIRFRKDQAWLSSGFFQFIGLISYSLYLTHCLIGNKLIRLLKSSLDWRPEKIPLTFGILLLSLGVSVIFAYCFYLIIEKRSITWSRIISAWIK